MLVAVVAAAIGAVSCATFRESAFSDGATLTGASGEQEVEAARKQIAAGNQSVAIPRLLNTISKYPGSRAALEARYWLGVAYRDIHNYRDAMDTLNEYVRLAPNGPRAQDAKRDLAALNAEYEQKFGTPESLERQTRELIDKLRQDPEQLGYQLQLADLLWRQGDYQQAGRTYIHILEKHPEYAGDATIKQRVERLPDGKYIAVTPAELQRRDARDRPLIITNESSFHSGEDLLTRVKLFYVVTGQAVNQGDSVLKNVRVEVTIYGFGNVVYETSMVDIGSLNPGEARAFSVRFSNFDNIDNVTRFECVGHYER